MRTLAIETASEACSVSLFEGDQRIAGDHQVLGRGHAEALLPMIAALPDKGKAQRILVSLGPGSFTGVRVGLAAARALGVAWKAQVLGYPTMHLLAAQGHAVEEREITVCMNGGHGEWFVQNFASDASAINDVQSLTPERVAETGAYGMIVGNRAKECAQLLGAGYQALDILPDASSVYLINKSILTSDLRPIYGRAPDAKPQTATARK
ncbi:MAG: tRNA (adenosine(37)-N6)-threonylcarbamoyltransferase complex dimerization subunit type 1 TsaB [Pseudomonadota bacterium]|nr:tRNA (adenosine(37)-N6)-threonylcarbamoyltransferase complex dimerization subunit type 1 TsaB [Pseudomonadota bacterium]